MSHEFPIPGNLDATASAMLVANIQAGKTSPREIVCVGWDGASNPMYRFRDQLGWPEHLRSHPDYLSIEAWKRFKGWEA